MLDWYETSHGIFYIANLADLKHEIRDFQSTDWTKTLKKTILGKLFLNLLIHLFSVCLFFNRFLAEFGSRICIYSILHFVLDWLKLLTNPRKFGLKF